MRQGGQGGTPATPREKGYLSGGKGKPLGQGQKKLDLQPKKKVLGLDWHNVFQIQEGWKDVVPDKHIAKVWDLQAEGGGPPHQLLWAKTGPGSGGLGKKPAHQMGFSQVHQGALWPMGQGCMVQVSWMHCYHG